MCYKVTAVTTEGCTESKLKVKSFPFSSSTCERGEDEVNDPPEVFPHG